MDIQQPVNPQTENTSGQGKIALVPDEIRGWSWGALLLNFVWGLGNGTYIALLTLVPYAGIIMAFVLGAKGNEWAWRNKRWASVEQFKRAQHKWALLGVTLWIVAVLGAVAVLLFINSFLGGPEKTANAYFSDISSGSINQAYALMDSRLQSTVTESQFASMVSSDSVFGQLTKATINNVSVVNSVATLTGTALAKDGSSVQFTLQEVQENGTWKIAGIVKD
jgi:hypothetical protein